VDLGFTAIVLLLTYFFIRQLLSELGEQNSAKTSHMLGSECDLKTYVRSLGYPLPLQIGGPITTYFQQPRNLTTLSTDYI